MTDKKIVLLADIGLLVAALCWGGGFTAGDVAAECFPTFWIMALRYLGAAAVSLIAFHRAVRRSGWAELKGGLILGGLLFIGAPFQIIALKYTTPSKQAFLIASYVAIVPFLSWLVLKKRPAKKTFLTGLLSLIGIGLISLNGSLQMEFGDILSLVFAVIYSFMIVMTGICARQANPLGISFFQYLVTGVLSLAAAFFLEPFPAVFPAAGVGALLYLAIINTAVAFTLQNVAQRYTSDTHAAVLVSTESVFGYFCGVFLNGDPFTPKVLIGGLIVFGSVLLSVVQFEKKKAAA